MKGVHPIFHVSILRKHETDSISNRSHPTPPPIEIEGQEEWEVESILDCRQRRNKKQYLVSWKGFDTSYNSWEPESNLEHSQELLQEFKIKFPDSLSKHKRKRRK